MKLGLFRLLDGDRLLIVIHHLVIDTVSWRIIFEDFDTLYKQSQKGDKLTLSLKSNSFKDWSDKLTEYAKSKNIFEEKSYWEDIARKGACRSIGDVDNERIGCNDMGRMQFDLDQLTTSELLTKTNEVYGTEINDILLCGLGFAVSKSLGNEKILVSMEGHGREDIFPEINISRTVGWFTTVYPVILNMEYADDLSLQIKSVKEGLRQIPNRGIGYGVLKCLTINDMKEKGCLDYESQIEFNYLGQFDTDVEQMDLFNIAKESGGETISSRRKSKYDFHGD